MAKTDLRDLGPDFVLKSYDALAPLTIAEWIKWALALNQMRAPAMTGEPMTTMPNSTALVPAKKIARACRHLADIIEHQAEHGRKLPD